MHKIKVQLDFGVTKKIHSLSHSFFNNPPEGVVYNKSEYTGIGNKSYSLLGKFRRKIIQIFPDFQKLDNLIISFIRKESKSDLIHFIFHLGKTNKKAVIDYETGHSFIYGDNKNNKKEKRKAIKMLNKGNIKYLIPMHKEALKSFKLFFGDKIRIPQKIIYPTIHIPQKNRIPMKKKKKVIFISTTNILTENAFLIKGGLETLKAFKILSKKYPNYEFIILGKIPQSLNKKVPKNIKLIEGVSREKMWEMFNESQIFVQPCYQAPAMAFIEAMFFKLPIITTSFWGNSEYVDKKNGIILNSKEINHLNKYNIPRYTKEILGKIKQNSDENAIKLAKAIEKLIKNYDLRKKLGENGFKRVEKGKFSIKERNKKLRMIYEEIIL